MSETNDEALLYSAVHENDRNALGQLLMKLASRALRVAKRATYPGNDHEDAVQRAFTATVIRINGFAIPPIRPIVAFNAWVLRRVMGEALNASRKARPSPESAIGGMPESTSSETGPFDTVVSREEFDRVLSLFPKLTKVEREAVELFLRDHDPTDVAEIQGIEPGTHSQRLHRGLKRLRKLASEPDGEAP